VDSRRWIAYILVDRKRRKGGEGRNGPVPGNRPVVDQERHDGVHGLHDGYVEARGQGKSLDVGFAVHWQYHPLLGLVSLAMNRRKRRVMGTDRTRLVMFVGKVVEEVGQAHEL
jgi:hypothetical protein